jgi:phenylacetate-CoA oxygenase PaaH subunit
VRSKRGLSHTHAGSLHAPDAHMALRNARDLYTRRQEGVSIWVVRAADVVASSPDEKDAFFDPAATSPTGTRPSTPCPTRCSTSDGHHDADRPGRRAVLPAPR